MSPALGIVFLGVKRDLRAEGTPNTNFFIHPSYDQEPQYAAAREGRFSPDPFCYIAIASLKDPDNPHVAPPGIANLELVTVVPAQPEAWGTTAAALADSSYQHNPAYMQAKEEFAKRLIAAAERVFPGLAEQVVFQEVATPLTHTRFTGSTGGTSYVALIPSQFFFKRPGHATEIKGLYLCGASRLSGYGIPGAMWSGVLAAARVAGTEVFRAINIS